MFEGATEEDIAVIQAYAGYPDPIAKRGAIFAITYLGKFTELRQSLKDAVLSIHTEGDQGVPDDYMALRRKQFADQVAALPDEPGLKELARALRGFT